MSAPGTLSLKSGADIEQYSPGVISANKLAVKAAGAVELDVASNQVNVLAGAAGGAAQPSPSRNSSA